MLKLFYFALLVCEVYIFFCACVGKWLGLIVHVCVGLGVVCMCVCMCVRARGFLCVGFSACPSLYLECPFTCSKHFALIWAGSRTQLLSVCRTFMPICGWVENFCFHYYLKKQNRNSPDNTFGKSHFPLFELCMDYVSLPQVQKSAREKSHKKPQSPARDSEKQVKGGRFPGISSFKSPLFYKKIENGKQTHSLSKTSVFVRFQGHVLWKRLSNLHCVDACRSVIN